MRWSALWGGRGTCLIFTLFRNQSACVVVHGWEKAWQETQTFTGWMRSNFVLGHDDLTGHHRGLLNSRITTWKNGNLLTGPWFYNWTKKIFSKCYHYLWLSDALKNKQKHWPVLRDLTNITLLLMRISWWISNIYSAYNKSKMESRISGRICPRHLAEVLKTLTRNIFVVTFSRGLYAGWKQSSIWRWLDQKQDVKQPQQESWWCVAMRRR